MTTLLKDYLAIFAQFPCNGHLTKAQGRQRHQAFINYANTPYDDAIGIDVLMAFINEYRDVIIIDNPLFFKHTTPILKKDIDDGHITALKFLINPDYGELHHIYSQCAYEHYGRWYGHCWLLDTLLKLSPDDISANEQKYALLIRHIKYSLYELPYGVLYGVDGATMTQINALFTDLAELEKLCQKLKQAKPPILDKAKVYYQAWQDYLIYRDDYDYFADYLTCHDLYSK